MSPVECVLAMRPRLAAAAAMLLLNLSSALALAAADSQRETPETERALDEVLVQGRRGLQNLRTQMIALEDRFYARYNDLNMDDRFDIHCADVAATGSLIEHRTCEVAFESRAHEDEGQRHHRALMYSMPNGPSNTPTYATGGEDTGGKEWIAPVPAIVAITMQRQEFRDTMMKITGEDAELIEMLRQRQDLANRYEKMRRRIFGDRRQGDQP